MIELGSRYNPKVRLNSICPYFTMFPLEFPYKALTKAKAEDWVLDPFCGRGTTNYAARLHGVKSFGIDSNLVASAIAQAKFLKVQPKAIHKLSVEIILSSGVAKVPEGEFWQLAYHKNTLTGITKLRNYFLNKSRLSSVDIALRAIMLGILHGPRLQTTTSYLSNQMPRTFATKPDYSIKYWKSNKLYPKAIDISEIIKRKAEYFFNSELPDKTEGKILCTDSRRTWKSSYKFNWVITSPPYFGMFSYEQDQWLRNWFLGGSSEVDYFAPNQIKHHSEKIFISDLAKVWRNVASNCNPNAKLIIRFGALPSKSEKSPKTLLLESISKADCGWRITTLKDAGKPMESNRQSTQFLKNQNKYVQEIDLYATLND